jgi:glycosyltransferase involved in cell wall biosynthesis
MHVLQLISSSGFFGAENVILELSKELETSDFKPVIGCFNNKYNPHVEIADRAKENDLSVEIIDCTSQFDIKAIRCLRKIIKERNINIIHSHNYKSNYYALISTLGMGVPLISTCHNWIGTSVKTKLYERLDKLQLIWFDKIVAVSEPIKYELFANRISSRKVKLISNGIDVNRFQCNRNSKIREEFDIPSEKKIIGVVGRLTEEKGHVLLIDAAKDILRSNPDIVFLIIGYGPLMEGLKNKAHQLPFIFTGNRNDLPDLYSAMDIFVLPSLNEGMPMVLLEAMAAKKPVVATNVGSINTVIKDRENGLLIENCNKEEL